MARAERGRRRGSRSRTGRRGLTSRGWIVLVVAAGAVVGCTAAVAKASGGYVHLAALAIGEMISPLQPRATIGAHGRSAPASPAPLVRVQEDEPVTVLVLGIEGNDGDPNGDLNTDSMMVLGFDPQTKTAGMLSVARDLWVDIPTYGYQRINTAMEFTGTGGAELTVEKYFGIPIEYYAIVDYAALVKLVDDVGGVEVDVPYAINDPCFPNLDENQCTTLVIPAGEQHMDGQTALDFARERHSFADSDIQRQRDQQILLAAVQKALLQPQNLLKLPEIIGDLRSVVQTNLPYADLPSLAAEALHLPASSITSTVPSYSDGAFTNYTTSGGAEVLLPDDAVLKALARQTFPNILDDMSSMTVQVQDAVAGDPSAASQYTQVLQAMGVPTLPATSAPAPLAHTAVYVNTDLVHLRAGAPMPTEAAILGQSLGTEPLLRGFPDSQAQIVVVLGADYAGAPSPSGSGG